MLFDEWCILWQILECIDITVALSIESGCEPVQVLGVSLNLMYRCLEMRCMLSGHEHVVYSQTALRCIAYQYLALESLLRPQSHESCSRRLSRDSLIWHPARESPWQNPTRKFPPRHPARRSLILPPAYRSRS